MIFHKIHSHGGWKWKHHSQILMGGKDIFEFSSIQPIVFFWAIHLLIGIRQAHQRIVPASWGHCEHVLCAHRRSMASESIVNVCSPEPIMARSPASACWFTHSFYVLQIADQMLSFQFKHVKESKHLSWCAVSSAQLLAAGSSLPECPPVCVAGCWGPCSQFFPTVFLFPWEHLPDWSGVKPRVKNTVPEKASVPYCFVVDHPCLVWGHRSLIKAQETAG